MATTPLTEHTITILSCLGVISGGKGETGPATIFALVDSVHDLMVLTKFYRSAVAKFSLDQTRQTQ